MVHAIVSVRRLLLLLVLALVAGVLVPATPAEAVAARARTDIERRIEARLFETHNLARRDPGRYGHGRETPQASFRWADDVAQVARAWSDTMASTRSFRHNPSFSTQVCCWTAVGENIAYFGPYTYRGTPEDAADTFIRMWMDSEGHRRNIMRSAYTQVGIGVSVDANNVAWATAVFRGPRAEAPAGTTTYPGATPPPPPPPLEPRPASWDGPTPTIRDNGPACPDDGSVLDAGFRDVVDPSRRHAVNCLAWWGITGGVTPTAFDPAGHVRRDQMASFIARAIERSGGQLPAATRHHFSDVPRSSVHAPAINALAEAGIIGGFGDGTFGPGRTVTRAHLAKFLAESFEHRSRTPLPPPSTSWFSDVDGSTLARPINQVADAGWAGGYGDGGYRPGDAVRRDHMAVFVTRWLAHLVGDGHADATPVRPLS